VVVVVVVIVVAVVVSSTAALSSSLLLHFCLAKGAGPAPVLLLETPVGGSAPL